jgi:predicted kinase
VVHNVDMNTVPYLIIVMGYPGAGKSTFAEKLAKKIKGNNISMDKIAAEFINVFNSQDTNAYNELRTMLNSEAGYRIDDQLMLGNSAVYDANSNTLARRDEIRKIATNHNAKVILVWIDVDVDISESRISTPRRIEADDKKFRHLVNINVWKKLIDEFEAPTRVERHVIISGTEDFPSQVKVLKAGLKNMYPEAIKNLGL